MPLFYRSMLIEGENPKIGAAARCLGVRIPPDQYADIPVAADGTVSPATGGLSVSPSLAAMPFFLIPRRLVDRFPGARGVDDLVCWRLGEGEFEAGTVAAGLMFRPDPDKPLKHGFVEPDVPMPLDQYQQSLAATCAAWVRAEDDPCRS